ncbi:hypothetical protein O6H91_13G051000 [Diphasiastrum complanatum]|uniref:Uncharacterized protein n=1 Tax=Diphasiastrum complanatum TaxID=34168 RepID=A0ACC2BUN5_DIPCM|nr:hypothetical protein O6H91_13G051000 [Diphasiastrum complanatum]
MRPRMNLPTVFLPAGLCFCGLPFACGLRFCELADDCSICSRFTVVFVAYCFSVTSYSCGMWVVYTVYCLPATELRHFANL